MWPKHAVVSRASQRVQQLTEVFIGAEFGGAPFAPAPPLPGRLPVVTPFVPAPLAVLVPPMLALPGRLPPLVPFVPARGRFPYESYEQQSNRELDLTLHGRTSIKHARSFHVVLAMLVFVCELACFKNLMTILIRTKQLDLSASAVQLWPCLIRLTRQQCSP